MWPVLWQLHNIRSLNVTLVHKAALVPSATEIANAMLMYCKTGASLTAGKFNAQLFPKLEGIQLLFSKIITAATLWVHLLSINLFTARTAYLQSGCPRLQHL